MEKAKRMIILSIIILFIVIMMLVVIIINLNKENKNEDKKEIINTNSYITSSLVKDENEFFTIKRIVNKYYSYVNYLDYNFAQVQLKDDDKNNLKEQYFEKGKEFLKDILIDEYTQTEDLLKYANKKINITKMEKCNYNNLDIYIVNIEYDKESTDIVVFSDYSNSTYSIMTKEYFNDIENIQSIIKNLDIKYIDKNKNNEIKKVELTDQQICLQYYSDYIDLIKNNQEKAYEKLDESYREKRFGSLDNFKKYIKENLNDISIDMLSKYQVKDQNEYNEYMCVDKNGRYYIFNVTSAMNYTLFLDTYTVDLPEFIEEYNSASNQKKMALNINKIISAINQKDYEYVYSKLDETFKQNYYNNQESLEAFIKENLFNKNKASFQEYSSEQNLGIYKVRVEKEYQDGEKAPEGKNAEFQNLNIIMKLGQGTDFVMSFSIGE